MFGFSGQIHIQGCDYSKEILPVEENSSASGGYGCETLQTTTFSEADPECSYCLLSHKVNLMPAQLTQNLSQMT